MDRPASNHLRRGRFSEPGRIYLLTTTTKDRYPFFADFRTARSIPWHLELAESEGSLRTLAWVLMPDHFHWLIELHDATLCSVMRRFKSRSRCALYKQDLLKGRLWQPGYHDHAVRGGEHLRDFARYVVLNPVRAGLVKRIGDYPYWNAVWL